MFGLGFIVGGGIPAPTKVLLFIMMSTEKLF